jgi:signal transduction histidine kinase
MRELSLNVMDVAQNSVRAKASLVTITVDESDKDDFLQISIADDGCGMTEEQVKRLTDPFFTTRKTRKVGLGIPFLTMLAEMTGGGVQITSVHESVSDDHGTTTHARFGRNHIDFIPLGDMIGTVVTLIQGSPDINFIYTHQTESGTVSLSCAELREVLEDVPLNEPEVLAWIGDHLRQQYEALASE